FPFPDDVKLPPAEVLAALPPRFRRAVSHDQPINESQDTLIHQVLSWQRPVPWFGLFHLAQLERRIVGALFAPLKGLDWFVKAFKQGEKQAAPVAVAENEQMPARNPAYSNRESKKDAA